MSFFSWKLFIGDTIKYLHQEEIILSWKEHYPDFHSNLTGTVLLFMTSCPVVCRALSFQYQISQKRLEKYFYHISYLPQHLPHLYFRKKEIAEVQEGVDNQNRTRIYPPSCALGKASLNLVAEVLRHET